MVPLAQMNMALILKGAFYTAPMIMSALLTLLLINNDIKYDILQLFGFYRMAAKSFTKLPI
jgi:hypothetical protein